MNEPTALYRLYDSAGNLLYVGITCNPSRRFTQHKAQKPWWPDVARKHIEWMESRGAAAQAEENAIYHEAPRWNTVRPIPYVLLRANANKKTPKPPKPTTADLGQLSAGERALKAASVRRRQIEDQIREIRANIERAILKKLKDNPDMDRDELAEAAGLSGVKVRAIAKAGGIPPRKPGGVRKRPRP